MAALSNLGYMTRVRDALVSERGRLLHELAGLPYLQPFPSHSNFILCKVTDGRDARGLKDALAQEHGIMVRGGGGYPRRSLLLPALQSSWFAAEKRPWPFRHHAAPRGAGAPLRDQGAQRLHPHLSRPARAHGQADGGVAFTGMNSHGLQLVAGWRTCKG